MINIFNKAVVWLRRGLYFTPRQVVCILIIILFLALAFRVLSWFAEPIISRDGIGYIEWAQALQNCDGDLDSLAQQYRAYKYSPLFISILALPIPGMTPHSIALMLNFFFGTALVLICFLLFKQVTNNNNIALAGSGNPFPSIGVFALSPPKSLGAI